VLICSEGKVLLAGCWGLVCFERKVLLGVGDKSSEQAESGVMCSNPGKLGVK
jgi:hypothetical protein